MVSVYLWLRMSNYQSYWNSLGSHYILSDWELSGYQSPVKVNLLLSEPQLVPLCRDPPLSLLIRCWAAVLISKYKKKTFNPFLFILYVKKALHSSHLQSHLLKLNTASSSHLLIYCPPCP